MAPSISIEQPIALDARIYKDEVFSWEDVRYLVLSNQIKKIHRHPSVQVVYQKWMKDTLEKYGTIENYLLSTKLHFPSATNTSSEEPPVIILPNDFPYSVEKGIKHILIWSQTPLTPDYVEKIIQKNYTPKEWEWVYFVNPPEVQSVKKLPHVHVFLRRRLF
ncbi:hypothetical protein BJ944DRAFT_242912 [Cunninghamella echinulata]|nr:hypothetical protein BJ944DRAFT_242912 [Cunninghamella echinulata]